jgi:hypothetical protein
VTILPSKYLLLPATQQVNRDKLDKIPSPEFIEERKLTIKLYWGLLREKYLQQFDRELPYRPH